LPFAAPATSAPAAAARFPALTIGSELTRTDISGAPIRNATEPKRKRPCPPSTSPAYRAPAPRCWPPYYGKTRGSTPACPAHWPGLFGALLGEMSARNEYSIFIDDAKRERILHGLFDNYYADSPAQVIFDTNRGWCAWMPALARLFPDAKVIACVRELPWVIDSIERLVQRNVFSPSSR